MILVTEEHTAVIGWAENLCHNGNVQCYTDRPASEAVVQNV